MKTLTETRVQHDDSAVHERLASMQQKLNSVEDAKSGAEASLQLIQEEVKQLQLKLAEKEAKDAGATVPVPIKVTPTDDMVVQTDPPPQLIDICTQMDASIDVRVKLSADIEEKSKALEDVQLRFIAAEVKHNADLAAMQQLCDELKSKADASAHSANELESKIVWATQRSSDLESELATLREEAKLSLDVKVKEVVAATQAARDALVGKSAAETEIQQLKHMLSKYEEVVSSNDEMEIDAVELREALSNAAVTIRKQEASLSELTVRLEAAEAASADGEAQNALLRDELAAKLEKAEESLKTARAENAKHEWTISELKSQVQVGEVKLKDATSKVTSTSAKLAESEDSLAVSIRELKESRRRITQIAADLERVQHKHEKSIEASYQTEMKLAAVEQRAAWAEAALVAFKQERLHDLEVKSQQVKSVETSHADNTLEEFKKIANVSLERRTTEMLLATRVASEATAAKEAAEAQILRMKQTLEAVQAKTAADVHLQSDVRDLQAILVQSTKMLHQRLEAVDEAVATKEAGNKLVSQLASIESLAAQEAARTGVNRLH